MSRLELRRMIGSSDPQLRKYIKDSESYQRRFSDLKKGKPGITSDGDGTFILKKNQPEYCDIKGWSDYEPDYYDEIATFTLNEEGKLHMHHYQKFGDYRDNIMSTSIYDVLMQHPQIIQELCSIFTTKVIVESI